MPYVAASDALNRPFADLEDLTDELGPPPSRLCLIGTPALRAVLIHWPAGFASVPHLHPGAEEVFQVVRGRALFTIGDEPEREVGPGQFLLALRGVQHAIRVPESGPLVLLAVVAPNEDRPDEQIDVV